MTAGCALGGESIEPAGIAVLAPWLIPAAAAAAAAAAGEEPKCAICINPGFTPIVRLCDSAAMSIARLLLLPAVGILPEGL
jgi:hypothetical protein